MINLEDNIKAICKVKGLTLTDLANWIGTSPSNLLSSIKGNPTVNRLQEIANALSVSMAELLTQKPERALGFAVVDGHYYQISRPGKPMVQMRIYYRYDELRSDVDGFVKRSIHGESNSSIMGMVEHFEVFSLFYDTEAKRFCLSLCYGEGKTFSFVYDKMEYADWKANDTEETCKWDIDDVAKDIINDIEGSVPFKYQEER